MNRIPSRPCLSFTVDGVIVPRECVPLMEDLVTVREFLHGTGVEIVHTQTTERWRTEQLVAVPAAVTK